MNRFAYKRYALTAFLILLTVAPEWFVAATAGAVLPDPGSVSGATKEATAARVTGHGRKVVTFRRIGKHTLDLYAFAGL